MTAAELYREMVAYLLERGWRRCSYEAEVWWQHDDFTGDMDIGEAVNEQLMNEAVNTSSYPVDAPLPSRYAGLRSLAPDDFGHSVRVDAEQLARTVFEPDDHRGEA